MSNNDLPIIVAGGGIGGIAAALALVRQGFSVKVLEQASHLGEIGNPFAVIHRADAHQSLLDGINIGVANKDQIELLTGTTVTRVAQAENSVTDVDAKGGAHRGAAWIAADGVKSAIRKQFVGDAARVSDHVVYRAVVEKKDFPQDFQWNAASIWVGPNCHLVHYPKDWTRWVTADREPELWPRYPIGRRPPTPRCNTWRMARAWRWKML